MAPPDAHGAAPIRASRPRALLARWSFLRMALGAGHLFKYWQVGDGREEALRKYVRARARAGNLDDTIAAIDRFAYEESFLINVGDEKGDLLELAVRRVQPRCLLELGTYCGYSALRMIRAAPPEARLLTIEQSEANADIARSIVEHAGATDRIRVVTGALGDGGQTMRSLANTHGLGLRTLDFLFIDHAKGQYLPDLQTVLRARWLRTGAVVFADNLKVPGAPAYRRFVEENEGILFRTTAHQTHVEYQRFFEDLVFESELVPA